MKPANAPVALPLTLLATLLAVLLAALLAAACAANPNEHIEANQYFRPAAAGDTQRQQTTQQTTADAQQQQTQQQQDADQPAQERSQTQQSDAQTEPAEQQSTADADDQQQSADQQTPGPRSDDVLRRYINPSYGYSFDLICPPFCDPSSNGIDRATFLADTGRALFEVRVYDLVPEEQLDDFWRESFNVPEFVETPARTAVSLPLLGLSGWRYDWEEDRRATGGFLVRWQATYTPLGSLLYVLRGGAVAEDYEASLPALNRAYDSFAAPLEAQAAPGRYERFEFRFDYGLGYITLEYGQPTDNPPTFDAGVIVLQSELALEAVLVWESIGAAFFDADVAIERTLLDTLGAAPQSDYRDARTVDGQASRLALSETAIGEGVVQIASFAWYCNDSGREFALHVLHNDDPQAAAEALLDGFRCQIEGAS